MDPAQFCLSRSTSTLFCLMILIQYTPMAGHFAYARVATKGLHVCGSRKIFHAVGFMCACHARMYADAPVPTLAIFCRNARVTNSHQNLSNSLTLNLGIISLKTLSGNYILKFKPRRDALYLVMGFYFRVSAASHR